MSVYNHYRSIYIILVYIYFLSKSGRMITAQYSYDKPYIVVIYTNF